ncbi:MAG: Hsp70 family protein [Armatimonadota bacterium]
MSEAKRVFGIDLGTTYSAIAYVDEHGMPVVLKNIQDDGASVLPSVVYVENSENVVVGIEAKRNSVMEPDRTFSEIKRFMGKPDYVPKEFDGTTYTPEYISSIILKKIAQYASANLNTPVEDVVITVPAYFGDSQRDATKKAGLIAGLNVLNILNEPTAAAISYGVDAENNNQNVMVFDLGGGTFDVTIIRIEDNKIRVVMTGGDAELGGRRWDQALVDYVADQFQAEHGIDIRDDENREAYQDLWLRCEEAKKALSGRTSTNIMVSCGERMKVEITRELFDDLTSMLCQRTIQLSRDLVARAKEEKNFGGIDVILLVGGSSKMPQIPRAVQEEFVLEPKLYDPDEAVAKGAALMARKSALSKEVENVLTEQGIDIQNATDAQVQEAVQTAAPIFGLTSGEATREYNTEVVNVLSHSIGIQAVDDDGKDVIAVMLPDQTELPYIVSQQFRTVEDNQRFAAIKVMENLADITDEHNIAAWKQLNEEGNEVEIPPNLPKGAPVQVNFTVDADGHLHIVAEELTGHHNIEFDIQLKGVMPHEEVEKAIAAVGALAIS